MTDITTTAPEGKSPQRHISIEDIYGELQIAGVMIAAAENFICELQAAYAANDGQKEVIRHTLSVDVMLMETRRVIGTAFTNLGDFISAVPASQLSVGEAS